MVIFVKILFFLTYKTKNITTVGQLKIARVAPLWQTRRTKIIVRDIHFYYSEHREECIDLTKIFLSTGRITKVFQFKQKKKNHEMIR